MSERLDEPYTRITNEILVEIAKSKFNGTQYGIIICILRNTYGFQRKSHRLSLSFISEATRTKKNQVKRELDKLIEMKVVKVYDEGNYNTSRDIGFNKYFSEWQIGESTLIRVHPKKSTVPEIEYSEYPNPSTGGVPYLEYQERKVFKESIKEISTTTADDESYMTLMDAYFKTFGQISMTPLISTYVMDIKSKGYNDAFIIELLLEAGESSSKPNLRFLQSIGDRWMKENINSREQAKQAKESQKPANDNRNKQYSKKSGTSNKVSIPIASNDNAPVVSEDDFDRYMREAAEIQASKAG